MVTMHMPKGRRYMVLRNVIFLLKVLINNTIIGGGIVVGIKFLQIFHGHHQIKFWCRNTTLRIISLQYSNPIAYAMSTLLKILLLQ